MSFSIRIGNHVHKGTIFATMCIIMVLILGIMGLFNAGKTVHANVVGVGAEIYWDQGCTNRTFLSDWGPIEPGVNKTITVYVRNGGDSTARLSMTTSNWVPSAALSYMTLNWNYSGQILSVGQVIPLELTLSISPSATGITHFSFDVTISTTN